MKYRINDNFALSRPPEGPVASYIISFSESLVGRGYSLVSTRNQVQMAAGFSSWLGQNRIDLADIRGEHAGHYLRERTQFRRPKRGDNAALRHLLDFLRSVGAIREEVEDEHQPAPIELHLQAYESYLRDARALNRQTIINYRPVVRDFLNSRFGDGAVSLAELRAADVTHLRFGCGSADRGQLEAFVYSSCDQP